MRKPQKNYCVYYKISAGLKYAGLPKKNGADSRFFSEKYFFHRKTHFLRYILFILCERFRGYANNCLVIVKRVCYNMREAKQIRENHTEQRRDYYGNYR